MTIELEILEPFTNYLPFIAHFEISINNLKHAEILKLAKNPHAPILKIEESIGFTPVISTLLADSDYHPSMEGIGTIKAGKKLYRQANVSNAIKELKQIADNVCEEIWEKKQK